MKTSRSNNPDGWLPNVVIVSCLWMAVTLVAGGLEVNADVQSLDVLTTRKASYTNVIVTAKSADHLFIRHTGGMANIKVADIDAGGRQALGYPAVQTGRTSSTWNNAAASQAARQVLAAVPVEKIQSLTGLDHFSSSREIHLNPSFVIGLMTGAILCYLFLCYCFASICRKAGHEPGMLIWIPGFQMIPLLRAAGMSGWWFLAFFVPVLNLVTHILWSVNIVRARNKSIGWSILMILPITNLIALLYLAFSRSKSPDPVPRVQITSPQPA